MSLGLLLCFYGIACVIFVDFVLDLIYVCRLLLAALGGYLVGLVCIIVLIFVTFVCDCVACFELQWLVDCDLFCLF